MKIADVLIKPIISEKILKLSASSEGRGGWYAFEVAKSSDKLGIKMAVSKAFGVDVVEVRMLSSKGSKVRDVNKKTSLIKNKRPDSKKAYVKLAKGQVINLLGEEKKEEKKKKVSKKTPKEVSSNKKVLKSKENENGRKK